MKIILVAPPNHFTEQLKKAFIKNGAEIICVNDREIKILPIFKNNLFLWRLIRKLSKLKRMNNKFFGRDIINICCQKKPDLLFINKGMIVKPETLKKIRLIGVKTANWFLDNIKLDSYRNWFLNNSRFYDYFISFDSSVLEYEGRNFYVPLGVDPERFIIPDLSPDDYNKYSCNICFIGAYSQDREQNLGIIKDLGLKIFGWKGWGGSSLAEFYKGPLSLEESIKAYRCAKICLNLNTIPPVNGVNLKTFEIPAAGGFQLSDYRKDVDNLFVVGKEIEIFKNKDELRQKAIFYLAHENLRINIALAGEERALREHTLEKRVADILKIVDYNKNEF